MSPVTTTNLSRQARQALQRVRKEISAAEQRLQELRAEEAQIQSVLETLGDSSGTGTSAGSSGRSTRAASPSRTRSSAGTGTQARRTQQRRRAQAASKNGASSGAGVSAEERRKQMLELLSKRELTREELAKALGVSKVRVGQLMDSLLKEKKVEVRNDPRAKRPKKLFRAAGTKPTVKAKA